MDEKLSFPGNSDLDIHKQDSACILEEIKTKGLAIDIHNLTYLNYPNAVVNEKHLLYLFF